MITLLLVMMEYRGVAIRKAFFVIPPPDQDPGCVMIGAPRAIFGHFSREPCNHSMEPVKCDDYLCTSHVWNGARCILQCVYC
jgi:hypothetical protein